jgi:hypothetical protein
MPCPSAFNAVLHEHFGHRAHDLRIKNMPHGQRGGLLVDQHRSLAQKADSTVDSSSWSVAPREIWLKYGPASHSLQEGRLFVRLTAGLHTFRPVK